MSPVDVFNERNRAFIDKISVDTNFSELTRQWFATANSYEYSYHFEWLSRPIIQYPQDIVAVQELIWKTKPDLIIETGIARGGSLIMSASMLALLDYCDSVEAGHVLDPRSTNRHVLGIDIDIRPHNRAAIEAHPMSHRIRMIEGSSISPKIIAEVRGIAKRYKCVMILLDSNHTHDHVLSELEAYAPLTGKGSYCIVFDTIIEDLPVECFTNRPWGKNNNPKTAVRAFLSKLKEDGRTALDGSPLVLQIDKNIEQKLVITVAPDGFLKRV